MGSSYDDAASLLKSGIDALEIHRQNYDEDRPNPKGLKLLWWEFPPTQWDSIRDGGSMCFLIEPAHQILPNTPMNPEELKVAAEFVDELMALGVLRIPTTDKGTPLDIVTNPPLFTLPKPGQPGQYRCIADMLRRGQNDHIGREPVVLPHPHTSLMKCMRWVLGSP